MRRTRALLFRLAVVAAGPLVATASGHEALVPLLLEVPEATLTAHPLSPVVEPPRLLELPRDVVPVAMDFAPPVPEVDHRQRDDSAVQQATERPPMVRTPAPQAFPGHDNPHGLYGAPQTSLPQQPLAPAQVQRLPPVQRERAALPPRNVEYLPPAPALNAPRATPIEAPAPRIAEMPAQPAAPLAASPQRDPMAAVNERAASLVQHGSRLADRNAFFSARAEFIQALRVITQALDAQTGTDEHSQALADGLRALSEADDFSPRGSQLEADLHMAGIVAGHRTPVLKKVDPAALTPLLALQHYYTFAQVRLSFAVGHEASGSAALYGLGKLTSVMAQNSPDERRLHAPKAMALYQAALAVDGRNHRAASELGVLLASFGQLDEAKRVLVHSAELAPRIETWHNLAVVHDRLGEHDLAKRARYELQLVQRGQTTSAPSNNPNTPKVQWVDAETFAKHAAEPGVAPMPGAANNAPRAAAKPKASAAPWYK